jgi:hypothetical protein
VIAAATALHEETEPRKLLLAALAVRPVAPVLARSLVLKARRGIGLRTMILAAGA